MLEIKDLSFCYRASDKLFESLDLQLESGHIYGLLGKNGAGKTTLLKLMAGLLFPQQGVCQVLGSEPKHRLPHFLNNIYFIPEEFYLPPIKTEDYMELYAPFYPHFNKDVFAEIIREFQLSPEKKLTELSYGQKKKFLVAFGLATHCKLLLLDEPTNGLDIPSKSQFRKLVASMLTEDKTFIISTHQVRDTENLIDNLVMLQEGKIIFQHSIDEISQHLAFSREQDLPKEQEIIYAEKVLGGYVVVESNQSGYESNIDLEVLFNAVASSQEKIELLFATEEK